MTERPPVDLRAGADALHNIARAHGYRLNDVEALEGARAVLRAARSEGINLKTGVQAKKLTEGLWLVGWLFQTKKSGEDTVLAMADLYHAFDEKEKHAKAGDGETALPVKEG